MLFNPKLASYLYKKQSARKSGYINLKCIVTQSYHELETQLYHFSLFFHFFLSSDEAFVLQLYSHCVRLLMCTLLLTALTWCSVSAFYQLKCSFTIGLLSSVALLYCSCLKGRFVGSPQKQSSRCFSSDWVWYLKYLWMQLLALTVS